MKLSLLPLLYSSLLAITEAATLPVGSGKTYTTIGAALKVAESGDSIVISAGTYAEQLVINKDNLVLRAATSSSSYGGNDVLITHASYASAAGSDDASATIQIQGSNVTLININISNTAGDASQAIALSTTGSNIGVYACSITAWQDTLYAHTGSAFFGKCYIEGAVDFIFGTTGMAWFQGCTLGVLKKGGTLTAQGRGAGDSSGEFVFDSANVVLGKGAQTGTQGGFYLGRPWGDYARVVFQNSNFNDIIIPAGWEAWSSTQSTANVYFAEYNDKNAETARVSWAKELSSSVGIASILGGNYKSWVQSAYIGASA